MTTLITGASSGIGYDLAKEFASHGYDVVLVARSKDKLAQLAQELHATYGIKAVVLAQDLSASGAPQVVFEQIEKAGITVLLRPNFATSSRRPFVSSTRT